CEFGRTSVVEFLLDNGVGRVRLDARLKHDGQTGLHWAAYGGHADIVRLLLEHGAPVGARDQNYDGTPLDWALYAWRGGPDGEANSSSYHSGAYYDVVALLVRAGAKVATDWYKDNPDGQRAWKKISSDPRMLKALEGKIARGK